MNLTKEYFEEYMSRFATKEEVRSIVHEEVKPMIDEAVGELARITGKNFARIEDAMATKEDLKELESRLVSKKGLSRKMSWG